MVPPSPGRALTPRRSLRSFALVLAFLASATPASRSEPGGGPRAIFPDGHVFRLEIARTAEEKARGYMFRDNVGRKEGMLFLFPNSDFHSFWMKNCSIPLDIIWLDAELRVVHIEPRVPPCRADPCPDYSPMRKAQYVLEVRAGTCERTGLRIGDPIRVERVDLGAPAAP